MTLVVLRSKFWWYCDTLSPLNRSRETGIAHSSVCLRVLRMVFSHVGHNSQHGRASCDDLRVCCLPAVIGSWCCERRTHIHPSTPPRDGVHGAGMKIQGRVRKAKKVEKKASRAAAPRSNHSTHSTRPSPPRREPPRVVHVRSMCPSPGTRRAGGVQQSGGACNPLRV